MAYMSNAMTTVLLYDSEGMEHRLDLKPEKQGTWLPTAITKTGNQKKNFNQGVAVITSGYPPCTLYLEKEYWLDG